MYLDILDITEYNKSKWVLTLKDRHVLINNNTHMLLLMLQNADNLDSAHALFQRKFNTQIDYQNFITLLKTSFGSFSFILSTPKDFWPKKSETFLDGN